MKLIQTELPGVLLIEPNIIRDDRGRFLETYRVDKFAENGVEVKFVQENQSRSVGGTIRGLHAQCRHPQAKLVRALSGAIFDVVVDIRRGSRTYLKWISIELS